MLVLVAGLLGLVVGSFLNVVIHRVLYKALHELEALQTRRLGGSAPLARLDVDGLAES